MRPDDMDDQVASRAEPLPEERAVQEADEDRTAEAAEILGDSERRVADAARAAAPGDVAREHRSSEESVNP